MRRRELPTDGVDLAHIAQLSDGFSGAELEQLIVSAVYASYAENSRIDTELLEQQVAATRPLSVLMAEKLQHLRQWASGRTVPA